MSIIISYNKNTSKIEASIIEKDNTNFIFQKEALKRANFTWNGKTWSCKPGVYKVRRENLRIEALVHENPSVENALIDNIVSELEISRFINFDWTLLKYKPIKGKPPFENFQKEDIIRALKQNRFLFNWGTGCGKSYALSAIFEYLYAQKKVIDGILVFSSPIGVYNIENELLTFCSSLKKDDILSIPSSKALDKLDKKRRIFDSFKDKKVLILSYDVFKTIEKAYNGSIDTSTLSNILGKKEWCIALDEVHYLGNPKTQRSKTIFKYIEKFKYRYLFTATLADKDERLYTPSYILDKKLVNNLSYTDWVHAYNDIGTRFSHYAINKYGWNEKELTKLNKNLLLYSIKRDSDAVLDIPELIDIQPIKIDMSDKHLSIYRKCAETIIKSSALNTENFDEAIIKKFTTMQVAVENPLIFLDSLKDKAEFNEVYNLCSKFNYEKDFSKLEVLFDIISSENEDNKRGIVWYNHPKTFEVLKNVLEKYNPICITANDNDISRKEKCALFKKDIKHKILIASVNVLTSSVTLSPEATYSVYYENTYNYRNYLQTKGRIHRIGQSEPCRVYHIYYNNSTDIFMEKSIERKESFMDALLFDVKSCKDNILIDKENLKRFFSGKN